MLEQTESWKILVFSVQAFKEITQKLSKICFIPWKKYYWHSVIQLWNVWNHYWLSKKLQSDVWALPNKWKIWWMLSSFWRTTCPTWCAPCKCRNSSKKNPKQTLFTLPKNECTRKAWITALSQKDGTSVQSQHTNFKSTLRRALFYRHCATLHR